MKQINLRIMHKAISGNPTLKSLQSILPDNLNCTFSKISNHPKGGVSVNLSYKTEQFSKVLELLKTHEFICVI